MGTRIVKYGIDQSAARTPKDEIKGLCRNGDFYGAIHAAREFLRDHGDDYLVLQELGRTYERYAERLNGAGLPETDQLQDPENWLEAQDGQCLFARAGYAFAEARIAHKAAYRYDARTFAGGHKPKDRRINHIDKVEKCAQEEPQLLEDSTKDDNSYLRYIICLMEQYKFSMALESLKEKNVSDGSKMQKDKDILVCVAALKVMHNPLVPLERRKEAEAMAKTAFEHVKGMQQGGYAAGYMDVLKENTITKLIKELEAQGITWPLEVNKGALHPLISEELNLVQQAKTIVDPSSRHMPGLDARGYRQPDAHRR